MGRFFFRDLLRQMLPERLGRNENVALGSERVKVVKNKLLLRVIHKLLGDEVNSYSD
jgi:hypothetical protein